MQSKYSHSIRHIPHVRLIHISIMLIHLSMNKYPRLCKCFSDNPLQALHLSRGIRGLNPAKAYTYHRKCALKLSHILILPYFKPLKQISPILIPQRQEAFDHAKCQSLPEAPGSGDKCNGVLPIPPLLNKTRLINIEQSLAHQSLEILYSNSYLTTHAQPSVIFIQSPASTHRIIGLISFQAK